MIEIDQTTKKNRQTDRGKFIRLERPDPATLCHYSSLARDVTTKLMDEGMVELRQRLSAEFPSWHVSVEYGERKTTVVEPHDPLVLERVHTIIDEVREELRSRIPEELGID